MSSREGNFISRFPRVMSKPACRHLASSRCGGERLGEFVAEVMLLSPDVLAQPGGPLVLPGVAVWCKSSKGVRV